MQSLIAPKSLIEQTYEIVLDAILNGTLKPGEKLTQEDIAARLNVSRQPVTHALAILKSQGFLAPSGKRGLTVTAIGPEYITAIYQFRSVVEPLAVELATARMTEEAALKGRGLIERGKRVAAFSDEAAALEADIDWHTYIYELSGNPIIKETMALHWRNLRRGMSQVLRRPGASVPVWAEHEAIFDKMADGKAAEASELMRRHLTDAYRRLEETGQQPS